MRAIIAGFCVAVAVAATASAASADEPFYKGKRLSVLINFGAGGPTDIEGRLFTRHLAKHIEGNPNLIVQNMEGAGGAVGTGYLGEVAPKDGTMVGYLTGAGWLYVVDPGRYRVDIRNYEPVAYLPGTTVHYIRTDVEPGMKVPTDIAKAKGLVGGGLSVDTPKDITMRLAFDLLGLQYKYVTGYRGSSRARLALQRGEINYHAESPPAYRSVVEPSMTKKGMVIPLFYEAIDGPAGKAVRKMVEGLPIGTFEELYEKIKGKKPSGPQWEMYRTVNNVNGPMQRMILLPPGAPKAAVAALQKAVLRLNEDKAFAEDAMKTIKFVPEYTATPDLKQEVRELLTLKPEMAAALTAYMKAANK
jgi:putative tricarboxylic transport membrane protein